MRSRSPERDKMSIRGTCVRLAIAFTSVTVLLSSAYGQSPATQPARPDKDIAVAQGARLSNPEKKAAAEETKPNGLKSEIDDVKAENAAVREQLRKMEEQQKALLELVTGLQRQLDGRTRADVSRTAEPTGSAPGADASAPSTAAADASNASPHVSTRREPKKDDDRYQDGIIIWQ